MKLKVIDRITLLGILPQEGDIITLKIIRKVREDLSFTDEEHKALKIERLDAGNLQWNAEADKPKEIAIGEVATNLIVDSLKKLNDEKKLTDNHVGVYEMFVDTK